MISADMSLAFLEEKGQKEPGHQDVSRHWDVGQVESRDTQVWISIGIVSVGGFSQRLGQALGSVIVILAVQHFAGGLLQVEGRMARGLSNDPSVDAVHLILGDLVRADAEVSLGKLCLAVSAARAQRMAAIITVAMTVVVKSIAARATATALCIGASGIR